MKRVSVGADCPPAYLVAVFFADGFVRIFLVYNYLPIGYNSNRSAFPKTPNPRGGISVTGEKKTIFLVDDDVTNLTIGHNILSSIYNTVTINSGARLMKMLSRLRPDMILLDVDMPAMSGFESIRLIKENEKLSSIPVIFVTARNDSDSELVGLSLGAVDYIVKPFSPPILLKRIEVHLLLEQQRNELIKFNKSLQDMVDEKTETVVELQNAVLQVVADISDFREHSLTEHITRTKYYLGVLIESAQISDEYREITENWDVNLLLQSSQLHDIGKLGINENILMKSSSLTAAEFEEIKKHTLVCERILNKVKESTNLHDFFELAKMFATTHHERWDGTGYPNGLKGEDIPLESRLMAIADVYDTLVQTRPYRSAYTHDEAVEIIRKESGSHFDPNLVKLFLMNSDRFKNAN